MRFLSAVDKVYCRARFRILTLAVLFLVTLSVSAQEVQRKTPPLRERLFFGGNIGLQFGSYTEIQLAPIVGLWLLPRLAVAVGPVYRYYSMKDYYGRSYKTTIYGGKAYMHFVLIQDINSFIPIGVHTGIFAHVEDEMLNLESSYWNNNTNDMGRTTVNTVLAGGGLSQQLGKRSSLDIMFLWALNQTLYPIYGVPEIRVSFIF